MSTRKYLLQLHASAERNSSKLKLIKSYLKITMSQERLSRLVILLIEKIC